MGIQKPEQRKAGVMSAIDPTGSRIDSSSIGSNIFKTLGTNNIVDKEGTSWGHGGQRTRGGGFYKTTQDTPKLAPIVPGNDVRMDKVKEGGVNLQGGAGTTPFEVS